MRAPSERTTPLAPARAETAGRSRALVLLLVALAAVLAAAWLLFARPNPPSVGLDPPRAKEPELPARVPDVVLESASRSTAVIPREAPDPVIVRGNVIVLNEGEFAPAPPRFSGQFVFEDGSIPPEMSFGMEADSLLGAGAPDCARKTWERTDSQARFSVEGLCAGTYAISPGISGLPRLQHRFLMPSSGVRVVLEGYLLRVRTLKRDGTPAVGATIEVQYVQPAVDGRDPATARWDRPSDRQGEAWFGLPAPGACTVSAFQGLETALAHEVELSGPSRVVDAPLVLAAASSGAVLRVEMRGCGSSGLAVEDYCIELLDPATGTQAARLCTNDARPQQVFAELRPGRFQARAVPKFLGRPVFYRPEIPARETALELFEGRETTLKLCVELGGRLYVLVHAGNGRAETDSALQALLEVEREDGSDRQRLNFRAPTETGVKFEFALPFGTDRATENVLEPGTYTLTTRAAGHATAVQTVVVRPGELTSVTVLLQKQ